MQLLEKLNSFQKTVLLIIAGIVSIIALIGLSDTRADYYVSAALARAFFSGTLMLVLSYPLLYYLGRKDSLRKLKDSSKNGIKEKPLIFRVIKDILIIIVVFFVIIVIISFISRTQQIEQNTRGRVMPIGGYGGRGR